jgi:flagellar hook-basal body complex protein FliE
MPDPLGLIGGNQGVNPARPQPPAPPAAPGEQQGPSFKDVLLKNLEQVSRMQRDADEAINDVMSGRRDDVANVMIAKQKADTAFQALLQVRNKLVDAYEEVRQMRT